MSVRAYGFESHRGHHLGGVMNYKQCLIKKGDTTQMSWIPERFAKTGKFLRLHDDNGWEVKVVYEPAMDEAVVNERSRDYTKQREASDI